MSRYILRFRGNGSKPDHDVARISVLPNTRVIDASSPRMLFVEGPETELRDAMHHMPDWVLSLEQHYQVPDPRPKAMGA